MPDEPPTLAELQTGKAALERQAHLLRLELRKLARVRPKGWESRFSEGQTELLVAVTKLGQLTRRICALVESEIVTQEDDGDV